MVQRSESTLLLNRRSSLPRRSQVNPRRRQQRTATSELGQPVPLQPRSIANRALPVTRFRSGQPTPEPDIGAAALLIQQVQDKQHQGENSADRQHRPILQSGDPCRQHSQADPAQDAVDCADQTGPVNNRCPGEVRSPTVPSTAWNCALVSGGSKN